MIRLFARKYFLRLTTKISEFPITGPLKWETIGDRWFPNTKDQWHDDVIKWKHFPRYWPFARGLHRPPVNSPHKGQWRGALMFSLLCSLNKRFSKQSWGWRFETPSCSLWRHCYDAEKNVSTSLCNIGFVAHHMHRICILPRKTLTSL